MHRKPEKSEALVIGPTRASSDVTPAIKQGFNMSDSTQVSASRAITVPFHGADLFVVEYNGQPYTPMRPIVEGMGLTWPSQFRKLSANKERWAITVMETPLQGVSESETPSGGVQKMLAMPLRKLPGWLASIESGKVKSAEARAAVIQYQNECDDVLWQYWNDGAAVNPRALYSVNPGDKLTAEEAESLRLMLKTAADRQPKAKQGALMVQGWSKLKAHFKVGYREIPRHEFSEAVSIIARHAAEWEVVDDEPTTATLNQTVADWVQKVEEKNGYPALIFLPLVEAVQRKLGLRTVKVSPSHIVVDRDKLAALWVDMGKLRNRINGLGMLESDLPPSWWAERSIGA